MASAIARTATEILDSKKGWYSIIAVLLAALLHLVWGVSIPDAMLLVGPLMVATAAQAHVDAAESKAATPPAGAP